MVYGVAQERAITDPSPLQIRAIIHRRSGRRGKLPSPVPHRSGRAQLTHPAPHIVASLREYSDAAIRRAGREYFLENRAKRSQVILLRCERRSSHLRHVLRTS